MGANMSGDSGIKGDAATERGDAVDTAGDAGLERGDAGDAGRDIDARRERGEALGELAALEERRLGEDVSVAGISSKLDDFEFSF